MSGARASLFIATRDVLYLVRQKEAILWTFVMPVVFFFFIGSITGGFAPTGGATTKLHLRAPAQGGYLLDELVARLEEQNFEIVMTGEEKATSPPLRLLEVGDDNDGRSFTDAVLAGEQQTLRFHHRGDGPGVQLDRLRVARAVYQVLADLVVLELDGVAVTAESLESLREMPRPLTLEVRPAGKRQEIPTGYEQAIPGTMVMFTMLVLLTSGAVTLAVEREQGLLRRLASAPISRGSIVLGKWAGKMAFAIVQLSFAMLAGVVIFGMNWGETVGMVLLVMFSWAAFNASLGILLANLVKTPSQVSGIGVLVTMLLAALGGCWWPIEITPEWMQSLALLLPTGWTMDALHRLVSFGQPASAVVPHVAALLFSSAVVGVLATRRFRYQ